MDRIYNELFGDDRTEHMEIEVGDNEVLKILKTAIKNSKMEKQWVQIKSQLKH